MAKTSKAPEIPRLDSDPEYVEAHDRRVRIQQERNEAQSDLREAITAREALQDRHEDRVAAILAGESPNGSGAPDVEHVRTLRQRVRDLSAAEDRARKLEGEAASRASARLVENVREYRETQMARLAHALAELGAVATDVALFQEDLSAAGLSWAGHLPAVSVGWMRQDRPDSRVNVLVDEISRDYPEAEPDRPLLEEALKARHRAHLEEQKRNREAGGFIAAGPDGVTEFAPGGKRKVRQ